MPLATNGKKICSKCRIEKPATADFFSRASSRPDGLKAYCKDCLRVPAEERKKNRSEFKQIDGVEFKTCTVCGQWKAATSNNFFQEHGKLTGHCKECLREKRGTKARASRNDQKLVNGVLSKPCTKCGIWKPAVETYFSLYKQGKGGLHPWCRDCLRHYAYDHALSSGKVKSHQDCIQQINGAPHRKCRTCGQLLPATSEYFQPQKGCKLGLRPTCLSCLRAKSRAYAEENKEKSLARVRAWIEKNKERHRQHALAVKAKRRSAEGAFTADDIQKHFNKQKGKCFYCLEELDKAYEIDHFIPLSKGGTNFADNIVLACKACNRAKSAKDPYEFLEKKRVEAATQGRVG